MCLIGEPIKDNCLLRINIYLAGKPVTSGKDFWSTMDFNFVHLVPLEVGTMLWTGELQLLGKNNSLNGDEWLCFIIYGILPMWNWENPVKRKEEKKANFLFSFLLLPHIAWICSGTENGTFWVVRLKIIFHLF